MEKMDVTCRARAHINTRAVSEGWAVCCDMLVCSLLHACAAETARTNHLSTSSDSAIAASTPFQDINSMRLTGQSTPGGVSDGGREAALRLYFVGRRSPADARARAGR